MGPSGCRDNRPTLFVTSSWDDGYPLDLRLAAMLARYEIRGTFYVPLRSQLPVMNSGQIRELARTFDIGGHTVHHVRLDSLSRDRARGEIAGAKRSLEDMIGAPCTMFCPPGGRFRPTDLADIRDSGYLGLRTVELMSTSYPVSKAGLAVLPTTLQIYPHSASTYLKNSLKRGAWTNLKTSLRHAKSRDVLKTAESLLHSLIGQGGVFHIWGHSWELEHSRLWGVLESVLTLLYEHRQHCLFVSNGALCQQFKNAAWQTAETERSPGPAALSLPVSSIREAQQ